jgi:hypothetical protein
MIFAGSIKEIIKLRYAYHELSKRLASSMSENTNGRKMLENKKLKSFELITVEPAEHDNNLRYSCSSLLKVTRCAVHVPVKLNVEERHKEFIRRQNCSM